MHRNYTRPLCISMAVGGLSMRAAELFVERHHASIRHPMYRAILVSVALTTGALGGFSGACVYDLLSSNQREKSKL